MINDPYQRDYLNMPQRPLPNATAVLVLGILSLVICSPLGIVGLILANQDMRLYNSNPDVYTVDSLSSVKAGRICSIIAVCLMALALFVVVVAMMGVFYAGN